MGSNPIRIGLILRCILFGGFLASALLLFCITNWLITPILISILTLFSMFELIRYSERSQRNFQAFLQAVRYKDYTYLEVMSKRRLHSYYRELFEEVMAEFRQLRAERESHFESMQLILQEIGAGILCFDKDEGRVLFVNSAALQIIGKPHVSNIASVRHSNQELTNLLDEIKTGSSIIYSPVINEKQAQFIVTAKDFIMLSKRMRLVVFQNIRNELDNQELASWQKLIRVLTHEIMNSATPIISLTEVVSEALKPEGIEKIRDAEVSEEDLEELRLSVSIIRNRSQNLVRFVQSYRTLTRLPVPDRKVVDISEVVSQVEHLFRPQFQTGQIRFNAELPKVPVNAWVDVAMIEQVLINLVKNASEAFRENQRVTGEISIRVREADGKKIIEIEDNAGGISSEHFDNIFIPFFTTKVQGSGIGLSLSRQIIRLHGGSVFVKTVEGQGTLFTIEL